MIPLQCKAWAWAKDVIIWQAYGTYRVVHPHHPSVFAYTRTYEEEIYLVVLNFTQDHVGWEVPVGHRGVWSVFISNFGRAISDQELGEKIHLGAFDGIVWRRENPVTKDSV